MIRIKYLACTVCRMLTLLVAVSILSFVLVAASPIDPLTAYIGTNSTLSQEAKDEIAEHCLGGQLPKRRLGHIHFI